MRMVDAVRLALGEFADPACRRCHGRGHDGPLDADSLCRCVPPRVPVDAGSPTTEDLPHPWPAITRRAQQIHAAAVVEHVPDNWSG
jgi:hypothetical protein